MKRKIMLAIISGFLLTISNGWSAVTEAAQKIIYIPMDNRPVCLSYVQNTAKAAGFPLTVPPKDCIANYRNSGNEVKLWKWLEQEAPTAKAAVISTDSLNYGGLVASRKHHLINRMITKKISRLQTLHENNPSLKIFAFSTIMRTPEESIGNVEPDYYRFFGPSIFRLTQLNDKEDTDILTGREASEKAELLRAIPEDLLYDWMRRRKVNMKANQELIDLSQKRVFHFLAIGKDDNAPLSQTHMEARHLVHYGGGLHKKSFQIIPGVDQIGLLLVTRAINEITGDDPTLYVTYAPGRGGATVPLFSDESVTNSVADQIIAAGCKETIRIDNANVVLAVNTPYDGRCQDSTSNENAPYSSNPNKQFAKELSKLVHGHKVSLADVSYANGADNGFMYALENRDVIPYLTAYNGWNTADNSIGFAIAQGVLSPRMTKKARLNLLKVRYLDDWIYQANVRYRVSLDIDRHDFKLKYDLGKYYNSVLIHTNKLFKQYVNDDKFLADTNYSVEFPWNRLFEVDIQVQ